MTHQLFRLARFRRSIALLLLCLGLCALGHAQNSRYDGIVWSRNGFPSPAASISVCNQPASITTTPPYCSNLASLCSSATDAACVSANPVTGDSTGNFHFYVKPGIYTVQSYNNGLTPFVQADQVLSCQPSNCVLLSINGTETSAPTGAANIDWLWPDSSAHRWRMNNNNAGADSIVGVTTADTLKNKTLDSTDIVPDVSLSSNVALYNNVNATWCNVASCIWDVNVGTAGGNFTIRPLAAASGTAGNMLLRGGQNSNSGTGGGVTVIGGTGGPTAGNGGTASITGGTATFGSNGNGGDILISNGLGTGAGKAGRIQYSGTATASAPVVSDASTAAAYYDSTKQKFQLSENAGAYSSLTVIPCVTSQKSESAADTNVLTCTPPAVAGSYRIRFTEAVSAQNTATLGWTATWKDANGSAQAPTNLSLFTSGTAAPALTVTAATNGNYYGSIDIDIDNSATAIVVKTTFAGTSFTSKVTATVERLN